MTDELYAVRDERNVWTKKVGKGHKYGWSLHQEFANQGVDTLPKIIDFCAQKYKKASCVGTRKLIKRDKIIQGEKTLEKLTLGDYEWKNYEEIQATVHKIAASLQALGFEKGSKIAIFAETREEWLIGALGALTAGVIVVTLYSNLSDAGVIHGLCETEVKCVITSFEIYPRLRKLCKSCPSLTNIIVIEDQLEGLGEESSDITGLKVIPYSSLLKTEEQVSVTANKDDLAIIMYTSGSTGTPKGVELTHDNIFHALLAYIVQADLSVGDRYLAFLPLAHIMELCVEVSQMVMGSTIAYSSPHTLTTNSFKIAKGTLGDAVMAQPTSITVVPLILDRIIKGISLKVSKGGPVQSFVFKQALATKQANENSLLSKMYDSVVFKKVKAELGGRVKMMVVGGAPLSAQTHKIIRAMFGCTIQVGYGCTETSASACSMDSDDFRTNHTGPPNPLTYIKLADWEEGGYLTTDKPHPRGEIVVGGRCVAQRYFKNDEETKSSFYEEDGINWFRTGDIGEFDDSGVLYVIDRRKDLVKLKNGEYISLGGVEASLKISKLIEHICVCADSNQEYAVAVVVPTEVLLTTLNKNGNRHASLEDACKDSFAVNVICKELLTLGHQVGLNRWDIPKKVFLSPTPWTPDSGLVTAAMKLRRKKVEEKFKSEILNLYNDK